MSLLLLLVSIHCLWMLCYSYPPLVLILFDTLYSLPSEIEYIWCKKLRLGSILYILARYSTIAISIDNIYLSFFVTSPQVRENRGFHPWQLCSPCDASSMVLIVFGKEKKLTLLKEMQYLGSRVQWNNLFGCDRSARYEYAYSSRKMKLIQVTFPGLPFARAYAISSHSWLALGVLGVLLLANVINQVVFLQVQTLMKVMN